MLLHCPSLKIQTLRTSLFKHFLDSTRRQDIPLLTRTSHDHKDMATFPMSNHYPLGFTAEPPQGSRLWQSEFFFFVRLVAEVMSTRKIVCLSRSSTFLCNIYKERTIHRIIGSKRCVKTIVWQFQRSANTDRCQHHFWVQGAGTSSPGP